MVRMCGVLDTRLSIRPWKFLQVYLRGRWILKDGVRRYRKLSASERFSHGVNLVPPVVDLGSSTEFG